MTSYGSVAAKVAEAKKRNPELFCKHPKCLWRTSDEFCPRHRNLKAECKYCGVYLGNDALKGEITAAKGEPDMCLSCAQDMDGMVTDLQKSLGHRMPPLNYGSNVEPFR